MRSSGSMKDPCYVIIAGSGQKGIKKIMGGFYRYFVFRFFRKAESPSIILSGVMKYFLKWQ